MKENDNVLELDELVVLHKWVDEENKVKMYEVEAKEDPVLCSKCGCMLDVDENGDIIYGKYKKHDTRERIIKDIAVRGYATVLKLKQRRFICPECGDRFPEFLHCIAPNDKITRRLYYHIGEQSLTQNFSEVAEEHGIALDTVKRSFLAKVEELDKEKVLIAPEYLGIDEIYLTEEEEMRKQPYAVFTDIKNKFIIEIVKGNTKGIVIDVLKRMRGIEDVKVVTMDMASAYRNAVLECCPNAYTVVDHFHVIQKTIMALDTVRIAYQNELIKKDSAERKAKKLRADQTTEYSQAKIELFATKGLMRSNREKLTDELKEKLYMVLDKYPKLKYTYEFKEQLRDVYKCTTVNEAKCKYAEWENELGRVKDVKLPEIKGIQRMINRLHKEVFAYFQEGWTNSFTETTNSLIRKIVRDGNGYGFEVLRGKILYGLTASKRKVIKVKDMNFNALYHVEYDTFNLNNNENYTLTEREVITYYVDVEELSKIIDGIKI